jgi:hypothetical protein
MALKCVYSEHINLHIAEQKAWTVYKFIIVPNPSKSEFFCKSHSDTISSATPRRLFELIKLLSFLWTWGLSAKRKNILNETCYCITGPNKWLGYQLTACSSTARAELTAVMGNGPSVEWRELSYKVMFMCL